MNKVYKDNVTGNYWGKIPLTSDDGAKKTVVIWGASQEYLEDIDSTPEKLSQTIESKWKKKSIKDDNFFNTDIHYDPCLSSPKKEDLLKFLQKIKG